MPGTWDRYYADADGVIFVVDAADLSNLPRAGSVLGASALFASLFLDTYLVSSVTVVLFSLFVQRP